MCGWRGRWIRGVSLRGDDRGLAFDGEGTECFGVRRCIPADCFDDTACDVVIAASRRSHQCGDLNPPVAYYCHSGNDECQSNANCDRLSCVFDPDVSHWACRDTFCETR